MINRGKSLDYKLISFIKDLLTSCNAQVKDDRASYFKESVNRNFSRFVFLITDHHLNYVPSLSFDFSQNSFQRSRSRSRSRYSHSLHLWSSSSPCDYDLVNFLKQVLVAVGPWLLDIQDASPCLIMSPTTSTVFSHFRWRENWGLYYRLQIVLKSLALGPLSANFKSQSKDLILIFNTSLNFFPCVC